MVISLVAGTLLKSLLLVTEVSLKFFPEPRRVWQCMAQKERNRCLSTAVSGLVLFVFPGRKQVILVVV